jgi:hypothetical protein
MAKKGMLGSGSTGVTRNPKIKGEPLAAVNVNPSAAEPFGNQTVAQDRKNIATQGKALSKQLKSNKSGSSPL